MFYHKMFNIRWLNLVKRQSTVKRNDLIATPLGRFCNLLCFLQFCLGGADSPCTFTQYHTVYHLILIGTLSLLAFSLLNCMLPDPQFKINETRVMKIVPVSWDYAFCLASHINNVLFFLYCLLSLEEC